MTQCIGLTLIHLALPVMIGMLGLLQALNDLRHRSLGDLLAFGPIGIALAFSYAGLAFTGIHEALTGTAALSALLLLAWMLSAGLRRLQQRKPSRLPLGDLGLFAQAGAWFGPQGGLVAILASILLTPALMALLRLLAARQGQSAARRRLAASGIPFALAHGPAMLLTALLHSLGPLQSFVPYAFLNQIISPH